MFNIADLVRFLANLVSPRFVDSCLLLCYTNYEKIVERGDLSLADRSM